MFDSSYITDDVKWIAQQVGASEKYVKQILGGCKSNGQKATGIRMFASYLVAFKSQLAETHAKPNVG